MAVVEIVERYPSLSLLDLHYLNLKHHGVRDTDTIFGRPTWNLFDARSLYHITFGASEDDSPYVIENGTITESGEQLPFDVRFIERVPVIHGRYYYFRHPDFLTPTLDDATVLNLNFQRQCRACAFCQFQLYSDKPNVDVARGFRLLMARGDLPSLRHVAEIAVVTGLFGSADRVADHLVDVIETAADLEFRGSIFYMGFELADPRAVRDVINAVRRRGLTQFRVAYTVESFTRRSELMHGRKGAGTLVDIREALQMLLSEGVADLQYAYIPGLDDLATFERAAEALAGLATPHLCVFRPWKAGQRTAQSSPDYLRMGVAYLCEMRLFLEQLYGGPLLGNNLGNLWPFPRHRLSRRWFTDTLAGPAVGRRWWDGACDLRALDTQTVDATAGK